MTITAQQAKEVLRLEGGSLFWKPRGSPWFDAKMSNKEAGTLREDGYLHIRLNGKSYLAHRLVWLITYGEFPALPLDHINRDRKDNRPENLREVYPIENSWNTGLFKNNSTGGKGVTWDAKSNKYRARISSNGIRKSLGSFDTLEAAVEAYQREDERRSL